MIEILIEHGCIVLYMVGPKWTWHEIKFLSKRIITKFNRKQIAVDVGLTLEF